MMRKEKKLELFIKKNLLNNNIDNEIINIDLLNSKKNSLDNLNKEGFLPDLIKIFANGLEHEILVGARDTIKKNFPTLVIEHQNYDNYLKCKNILDEYNLLKEQMVDKVKLNEKLSSLFDALKDINSKLWVIEDDKRLCEKNSDFGEKFIKLSRDIHFLNDKRASIKLEINNQTGSKIKEIKEYTSY